MKTGIYIRVSTDIQGNSLEMQQKLCEEFCTKTDRKVYKVYIDEDVSASKKLENRPQGKKLLKDINDKKINDVVSLKLDRMFRSVIDGLIVIDELHKKNVKIAFVDFAGRSFDSSNTMDRVILTIMLSMAEMERQMTADRTKQIFNHKKKVLESYSRTPPYGYKKKNNKLVPVKQELEKVNTIYKMHQEGHTIKDIHLAVLLPYQKVRYILNNNIYGIHEESNCRHD